MLLERYMCEVHFRSFEFLKLSFFFSVFLAEYTLLLLNYTSSYIILHEVLSDIGKGVIKNFPSYSWRINLKVTPNHSGLFTAFPIIFNFNLMSRVLNSSIIKFVFFILKRVRITYYMSTYVFDTYHRVYMKKLN